MSKENLIDMYQQDGCITLEQFQSLCGNKMLTILMEVVIPPMFKKKKKIDDLLKGKPFDPKEFAKVCTTLVMWELEEKGIQITIPMKDIKVTEELKNDIMEQVKENIDAVKNISDEEKIKVLDELNELVNNFTIVKGEEDHVRK